MIFGKRHWLLALLLAALGQALLVAALYRPDTALLPAGSSVVTLNLGGLERPATGHTGALPGSASPHAASAQQQPEPPAEHRPAKRQRRTVPTPAPTRAEPMPAAARLAAQHPQQRSAPGKKSMHPSASTTRATGNVKRSDRSAPGKKRAPSRPVQPAAANQASGARQAGPATAGSQPGPANAGDSHRSTDTASGAYYRTVSSWLERHKRYPKRAIQRRQQGTVKLVFTIDRSGNLLSQRVAASSGHLLLDREAKAMLRRAAPLPAPPKEYPDNVLEISLPIRFALH